MQAVEHALAIEQSLQDWSAVERYDWLTEVELAARVRNSIVTVSSLQQAEIKIQGSGRRPKGATALPDIVVGKNGMTQIEVVYLHAKAAPSPGKPLSDDLQWLRGGTGRHVIAFLPRMRSGYRITNHLTPYGLDHKELSLEQGIVLLTDCLQIGGLSQEALSLCSGLIVSVTTPKAGQSKKRWSLSETFSQLPDKSVQRQIASKPDMPLWAIIWSNPA